MIDFKTPLSRLVRHLLKSRDKWKTRALENQQELRKNQIKIRDLENSRNQWKERAKQAEKEREEYAQEKQRLEKKLSTAEQDNKSPLQISELSAIEVPKWHHYPLFIMYISICQVTRAYTGFRGAERSIDVLSDIFNTKMPCYSSIRLWIYRIGLYLLQRPAEYRHDWVFIADMTVQLGVHKCLLILGIKQSHFEQGHFCLQQRDVEVLGLEVLTHSNGKVIHDYLEKLGQRVGVPKQIVSDQGSDIKKGIQLYQQQHPEIVYIPDISHKIACLLKPILNNDEVFQRFNSQCNQTKVATQQTNLHFLNPPLQRTKARYHHIAPRIEWGQNILRYQQQGDFHLIDPRYCLSKELPQPQTIPATDWKKLEPIKDIIFDNCVHFERAMIDVLGEASYQQHRQVLHACASMGRQRFDQKLGWVQNYAHELNDYQQLIDVIRYTETQIKHEGLHKDSAQQLKQKLEQHFQGIERDEKSKQLEQQIIAYLEAHHGNAPPTKARLASSDIIESIFGQFKHIVDNFCLNEIGKTVLLIPLLVNDITHDLISTALEMVKTSAIEQWSAITFGRSALSLRNSAFTTPA
jgi:hypothetical protein